MIEEAVKKRGRKKSTVEKNKTSFTLPSELYRRIKRESEITGESVASIVRSALRGVFGVSSE